MVSLRLCRQVVAPNHCSIANKSVYVPFMVLAKLTMPFGCSATLRSLSHFLQFLLIPHGSYCVLHTTSFISSSIPLHFTTFAAKHLRQGMAHYQHTKQSTSDAHTFSQANAAILTGFHSAALVLHSLQSHSVHPLLIILLALRACHSFGFVMVFAHTHKA